MFRKISASLFAVVLMGTVLFAAESGGLSQNQLNSFGLGSLKIDGPTKTSAAPKPLVKHTTQAVVEPVVIPDTTPAPPVVEPVSVEEQTPSPPAVPDNTVDTEQDGHTVTTGTEAPTDFTITVDGPTITESELTSDPGYGVKYTKERIIKLPQDSNKFFVTVIGNPNDVRFNQIKGWFKDVPELAKLKGETHFNAISTTQADYKERYGKTVSAVPLIRVQTAKGAVVYQVSGTNLPMSGQALSRSINTEFLRRWRERRIDNRQNNNKNDNSDDQADDEDSDQADDEEADQENGGGLRDTIPDQGAPLSMAVGEAEALVLAGLLGTLLIGGWCFVQHIKQRSLRF